MRFEGKRVVVTGGASGIGKATVEAFIAEGAQVMMGDLNAEAGDALAAESRFDNRLAFQTTDVCDVGDIRSLIDNAAGHFGGVDILFNNAGAGGAQERIDEITAEDWDMTMNLLLRSVAMGTRYVVDHMKQAGGGVIINTSSINAHEAGWGPIAYATAKAGVRHLSKLSAAQLAQHNIRVNSISPGFIMTNIFADSRKDEPEEARRIDEAIHAISPMAQPVARSGMPDDIAQAVLYLASDQGGFVNGIDLTVDGGITIGHRHSWDPNTPGLLELIMPEEGSS
ncbi:SDR family oxidoreductase [Parasphingopyxis algicola]|uniref:SDR family NAD(P)-dependent oxidoreductase n=1 Tax=Parasphingopyxis algicola TaxID=2026624 RepID=UPI0015A22CFF|nr:SDR family oxidoreductase [Parasphingopyxis algicola]QLC26638.1 SDR family oxidoreductase [Parasphingopyxis algicola]